MSCVAVPSVTVLSLAVRTPLQGVLGKHAHQALHAQKVPVVSRMVSFLH